MKKVETTITCDGCGADLSDAGAMPSYHLEMQSVRTRNSGGMMYAVATSPQLKDPAAFCGFECVHTWSQGLMDAQAARKAARPSF